MNKKVSVIFGGAGGIGSETAKRMAERGDIVCIVDHNQEKIDLKKNEIGNNSVFGYQADITIEDSVKKIIDIIYDQHGRVDTIVFSVSYPLEHKMILSPDLIWEDYMKHFDIQVKGLYNIIRSLKKDNKENFPKKIIVLITEACFGKPPAGLSHYVTAKYALIGYSKSLSVELAKYRCSVNMVSPGMVDTSLIRDFPSKLVEVAAAGNPLKRIAQPSDVAKIILFLSSGDADYINGVNLLVNGGSIVS